MSDQSVHCPILARAAQVREGGATLMWFVRAMTLPFGAIVFSFDAVMGSDATPIDATAILGVLAVFIALLLYNAKAVLLWRAGG